MKIKNFISFLNERVETSSHRLHDLISYFEKSIDEHIQDLPDFYQQYPNIFQDWIIDNVVYDEDSEDSEDSEEYPDEFVLYRNNKELYDKYCEYLYELTFDKKLILAYGIEALPLFAIFSFEKEIENEWLVHFTGNHETVNKILKHGILGIQDMEKLAYTGTTNFESVPDGYCFAFDLNDAFYNFENNRGLYGEFGVFFKANGIKLYHNGDQQLQVIFIGNEAKDLKGFTFEKNEFKSLDGKIHNKDFEDFAIEMEVTN